MTLLHLELPSGRPLLVKSDALRGERYGGNKARKFEGILAEARRRGVSRLVSVGAIGSHHVLATAIFAREAGLGARCFVVPQPDVPSTHRNAQLALAAGAELIPIRTQVEAALRMAWAMRDEDTLVVPVGGSSLAGSRPYVAAAFELGADADAIQTLVVALGSGGTAAGLAVGATLADAPWRVHAVATSGPMSVVTALTRALVAGLSRAEPSAILRAERRLRLVTSQLGPGYARSTPASERAVRVANTMGLELEHVYTAKAFAHVLALDAAGHHGLGFWHTASGIDLDWMGPPPALPARLLDWFRPTIPIASSTIP